MSGRAPFAVGARGPADTPFMFDLRYRLHCQRGCHPLVASILAHADVTTYWPNLATRYRPGQVVVMVIH